ncbi:universal stress protein [Spongisporangium articulatum]|uniref:Universal stress protein n=1 Tax=Spongisporangium articulatum TaxID=3362603 RepID=A0ABW8AN40_9ACTN
METGPTSHQAPVVVGYGGVGPADAAVRWAAREARSRGTWLKILHAVEYALVPGPLGSVPYRADVFEHTTSKVLGEARLLAAGAAPDVQFHTEAVSEATVPALVEASREAELLVLGTHGYGELGALALGSTVYPVTSHAACPVVVVRGDSERRPGLDGPVMVAVDGSPGALVALRFAAEAALRAGASLTVMTVYPMPRYPGWTDSLFDAESPWIFDEGVRKEAQELVRRAADTARAEHPDLTVGEMVACGHSGATIAHCAQGFGLLVVGTRGHGTFSGLILGSVSHSLLHRAPCPVAVVR